LFPIVEGLLMMLIMFRVGEHIYWCCEQSHTKDCHCVQKLILRSILNISLVSS